MTDDKPQEAIDDLPSRPGLGFGCLVALAFILVFIVYVFAGLAN